LGVDSRCATASDLLLLRLCRCLRAAALASCSSCYDDLKRWLVQVVHEGRAASLKRAKLAVDTVGKGTECGLLLDGWDGCQVVAVITCSTYVQHQAASRSCYD
jgi:hypothetical protein